MAGPRTRSTGSSLTFFLVVVGIGFVVGAIRFWNLGDLSLPRKSLESGLWAMGVMIFTFVVGQIMAAMVGGERSSYRPTSTARRGAPGLTSEELSVIETELPEVERPEFAGVQGRPPEEMAQVLRKLSDSDREV